GRAFLLGGLLANLFASPGALAQSYPSRTVTIVVTSAAGALTDVLTRAVSQRLSQMWGQSIVVENRGGAGHNFAATAVKAAAADGGTASRRRWQAQHVGLRQRAARRAVSERADHRRDRSGI